MGALHAACLKSAADGPRAGRYTDFSGAEPFKKRVLTSIFFPNLLVKAPIAPPTLCAAGQPDRWRRYKRHPAGEPSVYFLTRLEPFLTSLF